MTVMSFLASLKSKFETTKSQIISGVEISSLKKRLLEYFAHILVFLLFHLFSLLVLLTVAVVEIIQEVGIQVVESIEVRMKELSASIVMSRVIPNIGTKNCTINLKSLTQLMLQLLLYPSLPLSRPLQFLQMNLANSLDTKKD